jgi:hypothetical protein
MSSEGRWKHGQRQWQQQQQQQHDGPVSAHLFQHFNDPSHRNDNSRSRYDVIDDGQRYAAPVQLLSDGANA